MRTGPTTLTFCGHSLSRSLEHSLICFARLSCPVKSAASTSRSATFWLVLPHMPSTTNTSIVAAPMLPLFSPTTGCPANDESTCDADRLPTSGLSGRLGSPLTLPPPPPLTWLLPRMAAIVPSSNDATSSQSRSADASPASQ